MIVRSAFFEGEKRHDQLFTKTPPTNIFQFSERVVMHKGRLPKRHYYVSIMTRVAALRAGLCLEGMSWPDANLAACEVKAEAFKKAGAKRPTWAQGQREYTEGGVIRETRQRCANCDGILEEGQKTFCGKHCYDAHLARQHYQDNHDKMQLVNKIKRVQRAANATVYPKGERVKDARDKAIRNRAG